ncbi:MAG: hypothetical protein ABI837_04895 [Acidobacteriota bacterium]
MPVLFKSAVALSVVLCMLGCAKKEATTSSEASSTTVASTTVAATQAPVPAPAPTMSVPPAGSVPPASPTAGAIATAEGENLGLRVDVTELKRSSGGALSLKFVVHNSSDKAVSYRAHFLGDPSIRNDYSSIGAVHIIDPVGKKKYFVTRDTDEKCVCSTDLDDVKPGSQTNLWAKFPAPPPEVKAVTVVIPHFTPMDDVPIQ